MRMVHLAWMALLGFVLVVLAACPTTKQATAPGTAQAPPVGGKIEAAPATTQQNASGNASPVASPLQGQAVTGFTVVGMTSEESSAAIEAALIKLPGVTTVSADFQSGMAKVQYDPAQSTPAQFIEAIAKLGFEAKELPAGDTKAPGAAPAPDAPGAGGDAKPAPPSGGK
jgi:copper chaperone CopZ